MLRKAGVEKPETVAPGGGGNPAARDSLDKPKEAPAKARTAEALECPLCMEPYADDDSEAECHVPRTLPCGHTACQGCYAKLLRPIAADGDYKKLPCPGCRVVTAVLRGKASNLQKNFALLR